ncbi:MAG: HRDC domain-containing protein [Candidatus Zixiibacteriota bacterium]
MPCRFRYIDDSDSLQALAARLGAVGTVALDTEADSLHHYYEKVCLIQLTFDDESYIVDPLADIDLNPLLDSLATRKLLIHGAEYDLRMLRAGYRFKPKGEVFDTMLAAQLVEGEARSLVSLVKQYLGVELTKQKQRSDWSRRPLGDDQLTYACNDTRYLAPVAEHLERELNRLGRLEWHRESCRRMVKATGTDKPPLDPDRVWRIKGLSEMDRRQLAFVREIWRWREREAQRADLPPFKIMGNQLIIDLALWASQDRGHQLLPQPKLPRTCEGARLQRLEGAIRHARRMREPKWPFYRVGANQVRPEYGPELETLREECARIAAQLGVEPSLVASRKQLEAIALARPTTPSTLQKAGQLMDWQTELLLPVASKVFET